MTIHPFALRLVVALVAASLSIVAARAETMAERVLQVVKAVCITPATPDDMTAAVQKTTEVSGWTLTHSAREHGVKSLGYSPLEPPLFVVQKRQIKDPAGATLDL